MTLSHSLGRLYQWALVLALITIGYNLLEGLVATYFGFHDETLALFGFGADSFIEVISGIGIAHMVLRMRKNPTEKRDQFEIQALKITGVAFYVLCASLSATVVLNIYLGKQPETTFWGIVVALLSIVSMYALIKAKLHVGKALDSAAILADARCTRACLMMSWLLLIASLIYMYTGLPYIDAIGTMGIVYFCFKEGQECFDVAAEKKTSCCG